MALTKKCDRCGNIYNHYGIDPTFGSTDKNRGKVQENGFSVIYWLYNEPKFKNIQGYDLCPKCLEELRKWFNNPDATINIFKCTPMGNTEIGKQLTIDEIPMNTHTKIIEEKPKSVKDYNRMVRGMLNGQDPKKLPVKPINKEDYKGGRKRNNNE